MEMSQVAKWIVISGQLGYAAHFELFTSRLIDWAAVADFDNEPLCQYFSMFSALLQGTCLSKVESLLSDAADLG